MDPAWLGIAEAGRLFRSRALSPVELTRRLLERIEQVDGSIHAFLLVTPEIALAQAKQAEAELAAGRDRGPMHGIPYALKDIVDVAGLATTCHSKIRREHRATQDAPVVARLREAGAVLLGKTALHEFAIGGPALDLPWPAARNPWNTALHPGGSSSGSGAALAAGLVPATIGTDTGGSIRNPATCCGIVGMKPTHGLVSAEGVFPLASSLDHVGPMTRGVEDNALFLGAMTGDAGFAASLRQGIAGLRIGVIEHFYAEDEEANVEQVRAIGEAVKVLRGLGAEVSPVRLPPLADWVDCGRIVQQFEQYAVHKDWLTNRPQDYCGLGREKLLGGAKLTPVDYERATRKRAELKAEFERALAGSDAFITLSGLELPCRIDRPDDVARTYMRHARMPFNLTGTPALAVPTGFSADGLPLGMQIAGPARGEAMLYRIAAAYEGATSWKDRRPSI